MPNPDRDKDKLFRSYLLEIIIFIIAYCNTYVIFSRTSVTFFKVGFPFPFNFDYDLGDLQAIVSFECTRNDNPLLFHIAYV